MQKKQRLRALKPQPKLESDTVSPESVFDSKDPGDDVLRRFRYQITYAGILSVIMVENDLFEELYCEHHEDILVKHKDNTYTGIQIKTKDLDLPPFNIKDESIFNCLKRFINLEASFPDKFKHYSIVSNHGFDKSKPHLCLNTLIENIKIGNNVTAPRSNSLTLIKKLCKETSRTQDFVLGVIAKVRLSSYCNLNDINMKLVNQLKNCKLLKGVTESKLQDIADLIIAKCLKASSLENSDEDLIQHYVTGNSSIEDIIKQCIKDKCIRKADFVSWLLSEKAVPVQLLLKDRNRNDPSSLGFRKLEIKMDAGGIDSDNISDIKDFKFSFEQHSLAWMYKDPEEANRKYNQILAVTKNLCKEIYDEKEIAKNKSDGQEMLIEVRKGIKDRRATDPSIFIDCTYEHVLGAVGVLTESCKVWWTPKFDIKE